MIRWHRTRPHGVFGEGHDKLRLRFESLSGAFNTRTYQSAVSFDSPEPGEVYHIEGPILRRMTAEQMWDSILTLAVIDLDER